MTQHAARRRKVLAALACLAAPWGRAAPQPDAIAPDTSVFPQMDAKMRAGNRLLLEKKFLAGHTLLAEALAIVEADPARRWPFRAMVLPHLGFAELALGNTRQAVELLFQAIHTQDRITAEQLQPFARLPAAMETAMGKQLLKIEYGRQLLSAIGAPQAVRTVGEIPFDTTHATAEVWFTTARALHADGDFARLARFYRERIATLQAAADDLPAMLAQEYRHFKVGLLLWQAGQEAAAGEAYAAALRTNGQRFSCLERTGATMEGLWSGVAMRRTIVSAQLEQARRAGNLQRHAGALLQSVLAAKGGGARYQEALMHKLNASLDARLIACRQQLRQLEDQIAALPQTLTDVTVFMQLSAMHGMLVSQASAALRIAGLDSIDLALLQDSLGKHALIGFFVYAPPSATALVQAPPRYLRYCVHATGIALHDLGPQAALEQAVHRYRAALTRKTDAAGAATLAQLLLRDLPTAVLAAPEWIIDADAALHLLPFDALPDAGGQPLALTRNCRHVSSPVQLLPRQDQAANARPGQGQGPGPAAIFADPAYGAGLAQPASATMRFAMPGHASAGERQRLVAVAPLPDTAGEAQAVLASLRQLGIASVLHQGIYASIGAMQASEAPIVLHVAAHAILGQDIDAATAPTPRQEQEWMDMLLPGRRAGLLLSRGGQADLMLAKDIARLRLHGTQLVVLSACNTGNGTVLPGEGLASLRRAVEMAGARSSITSLWSVPSEASAELMRHLYGHIGAGMAPGAALHRAKQALIRQGRPPLDWAGFVFAGTDAALVAPQRAA